MLRRSEPGWMECEETLKFKSQFSNEFMVLNSPPGCKVEAHTQLENVSSFRFRKTRRPFVFLLQ